MFLFFQQFGAQNVLILLLTTIYSFMVQRPSSVYVLDAQFLVQERVYI